MFHMYSMMDVCLHADYQTQVYTAGATAAPKMYNIKAAPGCRRHNMQWYDDTEWTPLESRWSVNASFLAFYSWTRARGELEGTRGGYCYLSTFCLTVHELCGRAKKRRMQTAEEDWIVLSQQISCPLHAAHMNLCVGIRKEVREEY